ncbi:hypothetical protein EV356DRAFT_565809 [Viridothelium virens]|uniref:NACHT domain-containing protein n=1 Tax=Viridothelium virens TaxID=1048519 RepID=A0A6A6HDZ8_VIRVR|nr:hypothetical protein EV356DRAFT_565809 [Viridothelium virens]
MLDPLSALSVAAAVVQFVDYGTKLARRVSEIAARGSTADNDEIEKTTIQLRSLSASAREHSRSGNDQLSAPEQGLNSIAFSCCGVADELIALLGELKLGDSRNIFRSIKNAYKIEQKQDRISRLQSTLEGLQVQMNQQLLLVLRERSSKALQRLDQLAERDKQMEASMTNKLDLLKEELFSTLGSKSRDHGKVKDLLYGVLEEGTKVGKQQKILFSLKFDAIKARHERIKPAHERTYAWMFAESQPPVSSESNFMNWLVSGTGIFWISGKAGSGKSTLMKFICDHAKTKEALVRWAQIAWIIPKSYSGITAEALRRQAEDRKELVIASHFFWSNGNPMQKSQEGLLQTLMYDIFRQCPDLIEAVCPARWNADGIHSEISDIWTLKELSQAVDSLQRILAQLDEKSIKFCFFIDGLDEYKGEHKDVIHILKRLTGSAHIKICASSRPWNVFEDAFGSSPQMLVLQDLTREDIRTYIKDVLEEDPQFKRMQSRDDQCAELVQEITDKANGVFLWVSLVVAELLKSVQNEDGIEDLRRRVESLPSSLEEYFQHIFDSIDPFYQKQTSQILQLCVRAHQPLPVIAFSIFDHEDDCAIKTRVGSANPREIDSMQNILKRRIGGRCKDLLEVNRYWKHFPYETRTVEFIHRTVKDFLSNQHMRDMLVLRSGPDFDVLGMLGRACLLLVKKFPVQEIAPHMDIVDYHGRLKFGYWIEELFEYVSELEAEQSRTDHALLEALETAVYDWVGSSPQQWAPLVRPLAYRSFESDIPSIYQINSFLGLTVDYGLRKFVGEKIRREPWLIDQSTDAFALLDCSFRNPRRPNAQLTAFLLEVVASPEVAAQQASPWIEFLRWLESLHPANPHFTDGKKGSLLKHVERMIDAGGATNVTIMTQDLWRPTDNRNVSGTPVSSLGVCSATSAGVKASLSRTVYRKIDPDTDEQVPAMTYESEELEEQPRPQERNGISAMANQEKSTPIRTAPFKAKHVKAEDILRQFFGEEASRTLLDRILPVQQASGQARLPLEVTVKAKQQEPMQSQVTGFWAWFSWK